MENIGHKLAMLQDESHSDSTTQKNDNPEINIPDEICTIHNSFLINNFKFFRNYINRPTENNICLELFTHLNNCYSCFCVYSQTMRDYFYKKNEITVHANGVAK